MKNYLETISNIRNYLENGGHNTVSMNLDCSSSGFLVESLFSDQRIILKIRVDDKINSVIVEGYPLITIPKAYKAIACEYLMNKNSSFKIGYLGIDEQKNIYSHIECSFNDAPISKDTFEELENISISLLINNYDEFQQIARGVLIDSQNDEDSNLFQLLEKLKNDESEKSDIDSLLLFELLSGKLDDTTNGYDIDVALEEIASRIEDVED